jgi:hypothetical protein
LPDSAYLAISEGSCCCLAEACFLAARKDFKELAAAVRLPSFSGVGGHLAEHSPSGELVTIGGGPEIMR